MPCLEFLAKIFPVIVGGPLDTYLFMSTHVIIMFSLLKVQFSDLLDLGKKSTNAPRSAAVSAASRLGILDPSSCPHFTQPISTGCPLS